MCLESFGGVYGMDKTTLYLPPELRRLLRETARSKGTTEAALIREGIALVTTGAPPPRPRLPLFESGGATLANRVDDALVGFGER